MKYLVVGDVDQIQNYVFASSRLRAIRGASALLENTIKDFKAKRKANTNVNFLRWRGGQVVIELSANGQGEAQSLCYELEEVLSLQSHGTAHITTTFVDYDDTKFRECLKEAFHRIHGEKEAHHSFAEANAALLTSPYYHRCNYLPTQSASDYKSYEEDEEGRYISPAADARLAAVMKKGKAEFDRELLQKMGLDPNKYYLPYKLDDLFKNREGGYMSFIAADGNSIGQMLEVIDNPDLYEKFSQEMYELVLEAIAEAAKDAGIPGKGFGKTKKSKRKKKATAYTFLPLIPVIIAGDDMSLLVRAEDAMLFAKGLCRKFAELSNGKSHIQEVINLFCRDEEYRAAARQLFPDRFVDGKPKPDNDKAWTKAQPLTLSVGVAIAKRKFPISVYRRLAGELRDEAKQELRRKPEAIQPEGVIDFAVITTATAQSLKDLRRAYYVGNDTRLTMRPYTREGFEKLRTLARLLKEVPRSKRKFLYTELFRGRTLGQAAYQFVMARERELREKVFGEMEGFGCKRGCAFREEDKRETPLIDALELAELMKEED
jgi:hypothetical protein